MALGFLRNLFGSGKKKPDLPPASEVDYKGYSIQPTPKPQGGQFVTAGLIRKRVADGFREQSFIRADTHASRDDAIEHSVRKAKQLIDEQGDQLFRDSERSG